MTRCPWCEAPLRPRRSAVRARTVDGRVVRVPRVFYWECAACPERFYPLESARIIGEYRARPARSAVRRLRARIA